MLRGKALSELVSENWRVSHKTDLVGVFLFLVVDIVVSIIVTKTTWLVITKIGTKEDEESGLLMGFWRSLSGQPASRPDCGQQDAASEQCIALCSQLEAPGL